VRSPLSRPHPLLGLFATLALCVPTGPAHAVKIPLGTEDSSLNVGVLLQPQLQLSRDAAPTGDVGTDFFLRRARIIVSGNVTSKLSFFVEIDQPNLGKDGNWDAAFFIQDAFLSYEFAPKIWIDAGMILAPLSHHALQGATSLNTVDYHSALIRYPRGEGKIWRDAGMQLRGFSGPLHFRFGVFNGVEGSTGTNGAPATNPDDLPRFVGHVRWNFLGTEPDFFLKGLYFSPEPLLSVGLGADYQPSAVLADDQARANLAVALDVFLEKPLGEDQELVLQANVFRYDQGGVHNPASGVGAFVEAGYRLGSLEPVLSAEYFNARVADQDLLALRPGLNLWFQRHTFNLKAELAISRQGDLSTARTGVTGTAQLQLFY
jgi:Phosphate-selective porin O and P